MAGPVSGAATYRGHPDVRWWRVVSARVRGPKEAIAAAVAIVLAVLAGSAWASSPAGADPGAYPSCPPKENPDCFLLNQVNENVFAITPGQEGRVIAQAHAACAFMASDNSGTNAMLDYGVWFTRQPEGGGMTTDSAAQFALYAAKAYCPKLLP
jgi:hypothetical protein